MHKSLSYSPYDIFSVAVARGLCIRYNKKMTRLHHHLNYRRDDTAKFIEALPFATQVPDS